MPVTFPHDPLGTLALLHRVADGVARRDARLAQQQNSGGGEVLAMSGAIFQQEARQR